MVRFQFWRFGECGVPPSLLLLLESLWFEAIVTVRVPSIGWKDPLENLYLMGPYAKKTPLKIELYKNINVHLQWMQFPNL